MRHSGPAKRARSPADRGDPRPSRESDAPSSRGHTTSQGRSAPTARDSIPPTLLSAATAVRLPNGSASSLLEISTALDRTADDDLVRRPALEIAQASRMIAAALDQQTSEQCAQFLACVDPVLNKLFQTVELLSEGELALPDTALLTQHDIQAAAFKLRTTLRTCTPAHQGVTQCIWEKSILELPSVSRSPAASQVDPVKKAFNVLQKTPAPNPDAARAASPTGCQPVPQFMCSPFLAGPPNSASVESILPLNLQQQHGRILCRRAIQTLLDLQFEWPPQLPYFSTELWNAGVFDPVADAAAQKVAAALRALGELDEKALASPLPEVDPTITEPAARRMIQHLRQQDAMRQARRSLEAQVQCAKGDYCNALLYATALPVAQMIQASFIECQKQTGELDKEKKPAIKRFETVASGRCPLRSALLASRTAHAGKLTLPETQPRLELTPDESSDAQASYNLLARMVVPVPGTCLECGKQGKCYMQNGLPGCVKGAALPTIEKKAHIIPHAAAGCRETALLLHHIDGPNPPLCGWPMAKYLALPHNIFFLSSCFECFFDSGALALVKMGPPEFQFYRVTTSPRAEAAVIDFGLDEEMRALFRHLEGPVRLSCIDGLVVDLARPAKVLSGGVERDIPRVSHRYLDLHARAHFPELLQRPLVPHHYVLSRAALAQLEEGIRRRYPTPPAVAVIDFPTIHEWLEALARKPGPPPDAASP